MVGAPSSIRDGEVTCSLPITYGSSEVGVCLTLHARLSRICGDILNCEYLRSFADCVTRG